MDPAGGPLPFDEYLLAKQALLELQRSRLFFASPFLQSLPPEGAALLAQAREGCQDAASAISRILEALAPAPHAEFQPQPLEVQRGVASAGVALGGMGSARHDSAGGSKEELLSAGGSKEELLSRLLGVAVIAFAKLEGVHGAQFGEARRQLLRLKEMLKTLYVTACIPY